MTVDQINIGDIQEMKALASPPVVVKQVADGYCIMLNCKEEWSQFKKLLANPKQFRTMIAEYDKDKMEKRTAERLRQKINGLSYELVAKKSMAAAGLLTILQQFVRYYDVKNGAVMQESSGGN